MTSNILHRISKKGKFLSVLGQFLSLPAGIRGSMKIGFGVPAFDDNGATLFAQFEFFGNVQCQNPNANSNPKLEFQKEFKF
jgi:hypothetical protein